MVWIESAPSNSIVGGLVYNAVVLSDDGQSHSSWALVETCGEELTCGRCKFKETRQDRKPLSTLDSKNPGFSGIPN